MENILYISLISASWVFIVVAGLVTYYLIKIGDQVNNLLTSVNRLLAQYEMISANLKKGTYQYLFWIVKNLFKGGD